MTPNPPKRQQAPQVRQATLDRLLELERRYQELRAMKGLPSTVPDPERFRRRPPGNKH